MGNLAENERIKLKAMYFNSIAVALLVVGGLAPYLVFIQRSGEFVEWVIGWSRGTSQFTFSEATKDITIVLGMLLAFSGERHLRQAADKEISKINDPAASKGLNADNEE